MSRLVYRRTERLSSALRPFAAAAKAGKGSSCFNDVLERKPVGSKGNSIDNTNPCDGHAIMVIASIQVLPVSPIAGCI